MMNVIMIDIINKCCFRRRPLLREASPIEEEKA